MAEQGLPVSEGELLVTSGSQQGIDLVARAFLQPGDCVLVEDPSYLAAMQAFSLTGARVQPVMGDAQGMCLDALEAAMKQFRPKLLYLVSNFSNPTGITWSLERRMAVLRLAKSHEVFVLEDDPYGALWFQQAPPPPLSVLAGEVPGARAWCGYMSSLSKTVAGGLRLGWLVLPEPVADLCVRLKQAMDLQTSSFTQEIAARYLASGRLPERLMQVRAMYQQRCEALAQALHEEMSGRLTFTLPAGGMFVWARLADGHDAAEFLQHALAQGVAFVPGAAFFAAKPEPSCLRLSYSNLQPVQASEAVKRLARAWENMV